MQMSYSYTVPPDVSARSDEYLELPRSTIQRPLVRNGIYNYPFIDRYLGLPRTDIKLQISRIDLKMAITHH